MSDLSPFSPSIQIQERLQQLPESPGVYLMKDACAEIIYIGKAKILRNRVRSYFNSTSKDHRAAELLRPFVAQIDWIVTNTELEALLLEANLVQRHQPRYNVRLKDDKHFPYLMITWSEDYPRLKVVRKTLNDGNAYFGPYVNVSSMRKILEIMPKIFQVRECDLKLPLKQPERPCLSYHIGRCDAPCADLISRQQYRSKLESLEIFLKGSVKELALRLEFEMQEAAQRLDFERAAKLRDQRKALDDLIVRQSVDSLDDKTSRDYWAMERMGDLAVAVLLEFRDGQLLDRKHFTLRCPLDEDDELFIDFIVAYYGKAREIPREISLDQERVGLDLLVQYMSEHQGRKVRWIIPKLGEKKRIQIMAKRNAHMLLQEAVQRQAKANSIDQSVEMLQRLLKLPKAPRRIEGYDISHLSGTMTVASGVCFINGRPSKENYRKYKVETVQGIDDFASMREILSRRMQRLLEEQEDEPDLILIDGGKGQLSSAYEVMREAGLDIPMIGLAKRLEEVFFPGNSIPVLLDRESPALKLLQRVRDEAHRFAITFQRQRREKQLTTLSFLEGVAGIGSKTLQTLRKEFKTESALCRADLNEIAAKIGISKAQIVWDLAQQRLGQSPQDAGGEIAV